MMTDLTTKEEMASDPQICYWVIYQQILLQQSEIYWVKYGRQDGRGNLILRLSPIITNNHYGSPPRGRLLFIWPPAQQSNRGAAVLIVSNHAGNPCKEARASIAFSWEVPHQLGMDGGCIQVSPYKHTANEISSSLRISLLTLFSFNLW